MNASLQFLRRLAINLVVFTVFLAILWPLAGFGLAWEGRSLSFVAVSVATASILFAVFAGNERPAAPVTSGWRRLGRFLVEFLKAVVVLGLCAAWAFSLFVWKFGLERVLAVEASREVIAGLIGCGLLSVWYGLDRAYVTGGRGEAD